MNVTTTDPPVCSYPVRDYWRVYTLTLGGDSRECTGSCHCCNCTTDLCSARGARRAYLPEAVRGMMPAESRDWLLSRSSAVRKAVWQVMAGCECDPEFVSARIREAHSYESQPNGTSTPYWTIFHGLCHNVHMDRATQLRFAHDVLFSNRKVVTDAEARLRALGGGYGLREQDLPCRAMERRSVWGINTSLGWGALNHPDVLHALLSPDGSGFGPGLSDEVKMTAEILEPFDRMLDRWSPGLSQRLPLGFRSSMMHSHATGSELFIDLLLVGEVLAPVPVQALGGVLELVVAAQLQSRRGFPSDSRTEHMHRRLHEDLAGLGLMNENGAVACTLRKLRLKLALRMGQPCLATERMLVASKSWGKISLREKKKWIEIPVTADPAWTRKEPPHA